MADVGRPTKYSITLATDILVRVAEGESIRAIVKDEDMPAMSTIFKWLSDHQEFSEQYARAKDMAADAMAEDMLYIADTTSATRDEVAKAKLRVEARQWIAARLRPKKYGDRLNVDETAEVTHKYESMDDEQLEAAIEAAKNKLP